MENKIPDINDLATKAALNIKVTKVESKRPDITNLATKAALNTKAIETKNKIADTTGFIAIFELNQLTQISFDAKRKEAAKSLTSKSQVDNALDKINKL